MNRPFVLLAALVLSAPLLSASKPKGEFQTAKLISSDQQEVTENSGSHTTGTLDSNGAYTARSTPQQWTFLDCVVVIDNGSMIYFGTERLGFRWSHVPQFTENEMVRYQLNGDKLTVIDDAGKEIKLKVFKKRIKE